MIFDYLQSYLPKLMNEEDTKKIIDNYIKDEGLSQSDFGKIMGLLKKGILIIKLI